jgi:hypothetical protein
MIKIAFAAAVVTASAAIVSPALAMKLCLDENKTVYQSVSAVARAVQTFHGPPSHSWKELIVDGMADWALKESAKANFYIPKCPPDMKVEAGVPRRRVTLEEVRRMMAEPPTDD